MIWLAAWVMFSWIVVPLGALVLVRRRESKHKRQTSVESGAEVRDCDMWANLQSLQVATSSESVESEVPVRSK